MNHPRSVWLVRHGQTDWNLARRYLSVTDRPLTAYGLLQAQALGRFFAPRKIDVIIYSDLERTRQVARAIAGRRTVPIVANPQWREASHGVWEGLTFRQVLDKYPEEARQRFQDPVNTGPSSGESLAQLRERVIEAWRKLAEHYRDQRVVVVTHATPIQVFLCQLTNVPLTEYWRWRIDLGSATGLDCYPGTTIIRAVNVVPPCR